MKIDNTSQLCNYDVPFYGQQYSYVTCYISLQIQMTLSFKVDDYSHFIFKGIKIVNMKTFASVFSFVLCFKATDHTGASNYVISAN